MLRSGSFSGPPSHGEHLNEHLVSFDALGLRRAELLWGAGTLEDSGHIDDSAT